MDYEELFMEILDILGQNFDTTLDRASSVSEQIVELIQEHVEYDE